MSALAGPMSKATGSRPDASTVTLAIPPRFNAPRTVPAAGREKQDVEHARQRRSVPAGSDVAAAHVAHDRRPRPLGDPSGLTELERAERPVA